MNITPIVTGERPLMSIGYKCNYRKDLVFISTEVSGSSDLGDPYLSCFLGNHSNVSIYPDVFPCIIGRYFNACNKIYNHNRIFKSDLYLDKNWVKQSVYFRLVTTVKLGLRITDGKLLF